LVLIKPRKKKKSKKLRVGQDGTVTRQSWSQLEDAYRTDRVLRGQIVVGVKGGLEIKIFGISAFLPAEHISAIAPGCLPV